MYFWIFLPGVFAAPRLPVFEELIGVSPDYEKASKTLKAAMNLSADPCTDFYEFACGSWKINNPSPPYLSSYGTFVQLIEKVKDQIKELYESKETLSSNAIKKVRQIYHACMNEKEINRLGTRELLKEIELMGFWPIIHGSKWNPETFDLTNILTKIHKSRGINLFFEASAEMDLMNVRRKIIKFDQGSLGLGKGSRSYYLDKKKFSKQIDAYRNLLIQRATQLTKDIGFPVNKVKIASDVEEVLNFETRFAEITVPEEERRNLSQLYHPLYLHDLYNHISIIDWETLFINISPFTLHSYLNNNPGVILTEPAFFGRLANLLISTNSEVITNYVMFRFFESFDLQLGSTYQNIDQEFAYHMNGQMERPPRWTECITKSNEKMPNAAGAMYVKKHFDSNSKEAILELIADLQAAFKEMLEKSDWMDEETKTIAKEKAGRMQKLIAYPDFILDDNRLDSFYEKLEIEATDSFNTMISKTVRFKNEFNFNRLLEPVDLAEFGKNAAEVNAHYEETQNAIKFPAAIIQLPFFHKSYPKALNYGGIGAIIGHEITHGFDDKGRQTDAVGNLRDWWNEKTTQRYLERTKCIIEQYGNVTVPFTGLNINGKLTQGENVADNGGVKEALKAYKRYLAKNGPENKIPGFEKFTNEQMFYIGYGQTWCGYSTPESLTSQILTDPHSPLKYRTNIVLQNQPEFAAAFNCPAGSLMNPQKRCSVW